MIDKPDAIIITIPAKFFQDYIGGLKQFEHVMNQMNHIDIIWSNTIANIPKQEILYCYLCYYNKIQYRLNIIDFEKGKTKSFVQSAGVFSEDDNIEREFKNKNWVNLSGPVIKAPVDIHFQGFQGFRYTEKFF
jgi:hypothetical protein